MSSTITKLIRLCSIILLLGSTKLSAQQDCNATSVSMSCNNLVNISIGTACSQPILPQDLLTHNSFSCYNNFTVTILNTNLGNMIGAAQVGKTYDVKVTHTLSNNACWGKVKVEDKTAPVISCPTAALTVNCSTPNLNISNNPKVVFDNIPNNGITNVNSPIANQPTVAENCGGYTYSYSDNVQNTDCSTTGMIATIVRSWKAIDLQGNTSTCLQTFHVMAETLDNVMPAADITLDCGDSFALDAAGNPSPTVTGYPKLNGVNIDGLSSNLCQIAVGYQDQRTFNDCAGYTVIRKWTLTNWCEYLGATYGPSSINIEQVISVKDRKKPSFISWAAPHTIGTDANKCYVSTFAPPRPVATDACDTSLDFTYELYNETRTTRVAFGAVLINIPPGNYVLIAKAIDNCGNSDTISSKIKVKDLTPPVAVCDQNTKIALTVDGTAHVNATSFDDGSYDICCIDTLLFDVKRMSEDDSQFRKVIKFDCNDATVQVVLRTWDCNGNHNTCMVNAIVEDKMPPVIFAEDGTITCGGEPAARNWLDEHKPKQKTLLDFPTAVNPGYYDNCGATLTHMDVVGIDACSKGNIKRIWTATDAAGRTSTTIQTVTVLNKSNYKVAYPQDVTINCENQNVDLTPAATGVPKVRHESGSCANVSINYEDKIVSNGGCRRITRIWKVLNLCANSMTPAPNVYEEAMQFINIIDTKAPEIGNIEVLIEDAKKECYAEKVELKKDEVKDNCSTDLTVTYTSNIPGYEAGFLPATLTKVPYGNYTITYRANDNCGNFSTKTFDIKIQESVKPVATCHDNLALSLGTTGQAMLMARQVDAGSVDNCTPKHKLKYRLQVPAPQQGTAFDISKTDTMYTFKCPTTTGNDSFRVYPIALWVGDESGNWDYCETVVVVQDNMKMCPPIVASSKIMSGIVVNNENKPVEGVSLTLSGDMTKTFTTDKTGTFNFGAIPTIGQYDLTPEKNDYPLNGVTTYDLVLMSKHILGVLPFSQQNQYIAGDVNKNGTVTTADIVELRRMILGIQTGFSKNNSWRFVEKGVEYPMNSVSSWLSTIPSKKAFFNLPDNPSADFTAVKVGDINQNARVQSFNEHSGTRSNETIVFNIDQHEAMPNEFVTLTFSSEQMQNMEGYQMALNYDKNSLELAQIHGNKDAFAVLEEGLITHNQIGNVIDASKLFGLTFRAKQRVNLTQAINLNEGFMSAEAYDEKGTVKNIALDFKQPIAKKTFEVYQNQPNPFNGNTTVGFYLPEAQTVKLTITDISGRVILVKENRFDNGYQGFVIDRAELNTQGLLYYNVATSTQTITKKMIVLE
jgi:hypothetical protein